MNLIFAIIGGGMGLVALVWASPRRKVIAIPAIVLAGLALVIPGLGLIFSVLSVVAGGAAFGTARVDKMRRAAGMGDVD